VPTKPNTSANLNSISIVNTDTAYVAGNGVILKTIGGGANWTSINVYKPDAQLLKYNYQYDNGGNITTETITGQGKSLRIRQQRQPKDQDHWGLGHWPKHAV